MGALSCSSACLSKESKTSCTSLCFSGLIPDCHLAFAVGAPYPLLCLPAALAGREVQGLWGCSCGGHLTHCGLHLNRLKSGGDCACFCPKPTVHSLPHPPPPRCPSTSTRAWGAGPALREMTSNTHTAPPANSFMLLKDTSVPEVLFRKPGEPMADPISTHSNDRSPCVGVSFSGDNEGMTFAHVGPRTLTQGPGGCTSALDGLHTSRTRRPVAVLRECVTCELQELGSAQLCPSLHRTMC